MSNPVDPSRTAAHDPHSSAASDRDETAPVSASPPPGAPDAPRFGPPVVSGEVGVLGPYRVLKQLGAGGMGAVYLALDTRLDRKLAMKVMLPEFAANADAKERFLREARAAAQISHDNVVTVFEADDRDGVPYIAMQFLQGYPLDEYLKTKGAPPLPHVIRIAREAALGLSAAHALGLVHRDVKPANLWLEAPNGRVKVLDFGLAKPVGSEAELTRSGAVVGTPAYMSPEQARGAKVDARTDLFSLGAVLYRLCTGTTPFAGPNVMAVLMALGSDDPTPVRELNPNVPDALAQLIHQLLAKKPEDRPQTATDVAKRLRGILDQLLTPTASAVVPTASSDVSTSMPVVVHAVPHQPPIVVPMQITAQPERAFANLDADDDEGAEVTEAEAAPAAPKSERKTGGKGLLIAAGVAVLVAVIAGAVVVSQMGKKKEPEAKAPETKAPDAVKVKADPKGPAVKVSVADPKPDVPGTFTNGIGMKFVPVPKGTGWLGGGGGKQGDTKAVIEQDFYLGKYEVTQEEWEKVTGLTPSMFKRGNVAVKDISDGDLKRFPVESVSWDDCQLFIERLNKREKEAGWVYRLPTESEWEYACRGGPGDKFDSVFDFYFAKPTNTLLPEQANFNNVLKRTCKVGSYEGNLLGLNDMHGNVMEWCDDAVTGADGASRRVDRGGQWSHGSEDCRAAYRTMYAPSYRHQLLGLRLARVPSPPVAPDPKPDVPGTFTNGIGMKFVPVPKGTGWLGGGAGKQGETKVEFKEDFYLGKYEVTQEEWEKVMEKNPSTFKRGNVAVKDIGDADLKRFPVENVSWDDCQAFVKKLNEKEKETGWVYRLPAADEWEYACRGGPVDKLDSAFDFYFAKPTNTLLPEQANFAPVVGKGLQRTCKAGSYEPNTLGLHDMHGNIEEWCEDAATGGDGASRRVIRGGHWRDASGACRAAARLTVALSSRTGHLGLRLARVPSAPAGK